MGKGLSWPARTPFVGKMKLSQDTSELDMAGLIVAVPEPSTRAMMILGFCGVLVPRLLIDAMYFQT